MHYGTISCQNLLQSFEVLCGMACAPQVLDFVSRHKAFVVRGNHDEAAITAHEKLQRGEPIKVRLITTALLLYALLEYATAATSTHTCHTCPSNHHCNFYARVINTAHHPNYSELLPQHPLTPPCTDQIWVGHRPFTGPACVSPHAAV